MIFDLAVIETGNGGDLKLRGNDLAVSNSVMNQVYLGLFGGNIENPKQNENTDWWANELLMKANPSIQFNTNIERIINTTTLNSSGRVTIENAIKKALQFLVDEGYTITVSVSIVSTDRIDTIIKTDIEGDKEQISIKFQRLSEVGEFSLSEFNDDFA